MGTAFLKRVNSAYVERVMAAGPVVAALERERIKLDTFKAA